MGAEKEQQVKARLGLAVCFLSQLVPWGFVMLSLSFSPFLPAAVGCIKHTIRLFPLPLSIIFCWIDRSIWRRCWRAPNSWAEIVSRARWKVWKVWDGRWMAAPASFRTTVRANYCNDNISNRQKRMFVLLFQLLDSEVGHDVLRYKLHQETFLSINRHLDTLRQFPENRFTDLLKPPRTVEDLVFLLPLFRQKVKA